MTQTFHLEADKIPVTFPLKCQGLDRFFGLAGDTAQETGRGSPLHSLHMPKNATVTVLRAGTMSVGKFLPPWSTRQVGAATMDRTGKVKTIADSIEKTLIYFSVVIFLLSSTLSYYYPSDAVGRFSQILSSICKYYNVSVWKLH